MSTQLPRSVRDSAAPLQLLLHGSARPSARRQHAIAMAAAVRRGLSAWRVESAQTFATRARLHDRRHLYVYSFVVRRCRVLQSAVCVRASAVGVSAPCSKMRAEQPDCALGDDLHSLGG